MPRPSKRSAILDAAGVVARREGSARLTLDAVAAEAGLSKGGLLYHFPSKEALILAMIDHMGQTFDAAHESVMTADPTAPGSWTRAYVRTMVGPQRPPENNATFAALLAVIASSFDLIEPFRAHYVDWRASLAADGIAPEDAAIVSLAADGLWLADLLGLAAPDGEERRRILERMLQIAGASS